ncbi:M3 family metallopeptidase [Nocardioides sp. AE5]|uniref:M3 family metallopeptidase n=1 Tax=Nocardioides sp. AE5 TaxID=2962573 RepID=UPI0028829BEB|nr:M3 family metallopeptidase [Nocardioides sp. AE5]MDT0203948.1 M3 family metallopeptidase [Nocardioides sp. AE5]
MTDSDRLTPLYLPTDPAAWSPWLADRCKDALARAGSLRDELVAAPPGQVLDTWNRLGIELAGVFALSSLLAQVHPEAAVREQAEEIEVEANRFRTGLMLDADVYAALLAVPGEGLDEAASRVLAHSLRDFRRAGVDRDEATRQRLRELDELEMELGQAFGRAIRDDDRTTKVAAAATAGLPQDWIDERPADADGMVTVTCDYPDTVPFLSFAHDAQARRAVAHTTLNQAWPENDATLSRLLRARHEHAQLLGYADWPSFDAEVKMIGSGPAIGEFIDSIATASLAAGERDLAVLLERARRDAPDLAAIDASNWRYWTEVVRREEFRVDAQEVRRYFAFPKVRQGLLDVTGRLFGLRYEAVADAATWHPDVTTYDVYLDGDGDGAEHLGRIHLDLHPRDGKYNHAAQFDLVPGVRGVQLAQGVLVCNFSRGLMEHDDVVTLFHEFGHLLHHVLAGRHDWVRFSGVATEWDFVEAPSQMLEEWAWDAEVLAGFATDESGTPIPADLVARMRAADEFGKGFLARTQAFYAAVSYRLHLERPDDITARVAELYDAYNLVRPLPDTHFHASFGHLDGYGSGYYTYKWSLVIAKDLFSAFDADDLFAPEVAQRYRDRVLAPGGSKDAADLVTDFLGRPYDDRAFTAWLERTPEVAR